ncbi:MAG TPA: exosortase K [Vicinamibacteria bacterium]
MSGSRAAVLGMIVLAMWALKRHYASADVEDLRWILWPTGKLVSLAVGSPFEFEHGAGYLSRPHLFLIEKSCAGLNFMIAALGMTGFVLSRGRERGARTAWIVGASVALSYAGAVLVNTVRILVAIGLGSADLASGWWTAARIHRLEGIVVYFAGLMLLDLVARRFAAAARPRRCGAPS